MKQLLHPVHVALPSKNLRIWLVIDHWDKWRRAQPQDRSYFIRENRTETEEEEKMKGTRLLDSNQLFLELEGLEWNIN